MDVDPNTVLAGDVLDLPKRKAKRRRFDDAAPEADVPTPPVPVPLPAPPVPPAGGAPQARPMDPQAASAPIQVEPPRELTEEEKAAWAEWGQYYDELRAYFGKYAAHHAGLLAQKSMQDAVVNQAAEAAVNTASQLIALDAANQQRMEEVYERRRADAVRRKFEQ